VKQSVSLKEIITIFLIVLSGIASQVITINASSDPTATHNINLNTLMNLALTAEAGEAFGIERIELYFENRRPDITVKRNEPITLFADINFTGSGLFQGYWEVDGRILSHVNQHLVFGGSITLKTPPIPPLPTFDTGTHIAKFVVTQPSNSLPVPSAVYFVVPTDYAGKPVEIKIISPPDKTIIGYSPITFQWEKLDAPASYSIQFFEDRKGKPIFSMCVSEASFRLSENVLTRIFRPRHTYYWRLAGCGAERTIGESKIHEFIFKE
jgi:hypothetical protein